MATVLSGHTERLRLFCGPCLVTSASESQTAAADLLLAGTGGSAAAQRILRPPVDCSDLSGATLTMYEMDHELASEAIRFASSTNDSPWVTTSGITNPELQGQTVTEYEPGLSFVNHTNHTVYGVFTSSIPRQTR